MKENKYDDEQFFEQYMKMSRSREGLNGAGEWHALRKMLPVFDGKKVLDLGCGLGWHCRYAIEQGAASVIGVDLSEKMLERAKAINQLPGIAYQCGAIEDLDFTNGSFDVVFSSLAFHYVESFDVVCSQVYQWLHPGGEFVFSVEHPVFTAEGRQDWIYGEHGEKRYWPVDRYYLEGKREATFLGEKVVKYHRTTTSYLNGLLKEGFTIKEFIEPQPDEKLLNDQPEMYDELRRPMMLLISATKN